MVVGEFSLVLYLCPLYEPFHHCEDIISFPSGNDSDTDFSYQLCAAVKQDSKGKCDLFFKHEDRFYQLYDTDRVKAAMHEELGLCTLLFYTLKKNVKGKPSFSAFLSSDSDSE